MPRVSVEKSCARLAVQDDDGVAEDMPPPSTQTVALLADLAAEADRIDQTQRLPSTQLLSVSVGCCDYLWMVGCALKWWGKKSISVFLCYHHDLFVLPP